MEIKCIFTYYTVINLDNFFNSEVSSLYEMFKDYHFFNCYPASWHPTEFYIKFRYSSGEDSITILNHFLNEGTTQLEFKEIMNEHYSKLSKIFKNNDKLNLIIDVIQIIK